MRLARARISNFRKIESLDLDFTDAFGNVWDLTVLAGPNTSGKTSVLEALEAALGCATGLHFRGHDRLSVGCIRHGALRTQVVCRVLFTEDEIAATRELLSLAEETHSAPDATTVEMTWTYPDPKGELSWGRVDCRPWEALALFRGRLTAARLLRTRAITSRSWFERCGALLLFDQERTGAGVIVRRDVWDVLGLQQDEEAGASPDRRTDDPSVILRSYAVEDQFPPADRESGPSAFSRVKAAFERLSRPHRIVGPVRDDGIRVQFSDGESLYYYEGLSSGQQMLLRYIILHESLNLHRSVVCVDEVELHLHPAWQAKLLLALPTMGKDNQVIATTHSEFVRDAVSPDAVIHLGDLEAE